MRPSFIAARVALGLGESPMFIGGARVCAERFAPAERAAPLGLLNASASLGPAIAPLVLAPLMSSIGWRLGFVALGAAGLLVAAAWGLIYRNPAHPNAQAPRIAGPAQWLDLIRQPSVWGLLLGFAGTVYITWLYVTWLPYYLHQAWHMPPTKAALWSALPQFTGFLGAIAGGWLSDRLASVVNDRAARQWPLAAGLYVSAACCVLTALSSSATMAIASVSASLFSANLATTSGWALAATLAPPSLIATVEAMANIGGSVGGSLAPLVTGALVQQTGRFSASLFVAAAIAAACAVGNQVFTRQPVTLTE
jgi:MFS family permease